MGSLSHEVSKHLAAARAEIAAADRILRTGIVNRRLIRLCDDVAMGLGSLIGSRAPEAMLYTMLAVATVVTAGCAWFFGFWAALIVAFVAALSTGAITVNGTGELETNFSLNSGANQAITGIGQQRCACIGHKRASFAGHEPRY